MSTTDTVYGIEDDNDTLHAVFATEREATDYLTRFGDDDDGNPFLYLVALTPDDVSTTPAAGATLPWYVEYVEGPEVSA